MTLVTRVRPQAGDVAIKDLVSDSNFSGSGTISLVDVGAEKAWNITAASAFTLSTAVKNIQGSVDGAGATIAARFRANNLGTNSFMPFIGIGSTTQGMRLMRNGVNYRGRILTSSAEANTAGVTIQGEIVTIVYKIRTVSSGTDSGALWIGGLARTGNDPNFVGTGVNLAASNNIQDAFINVTDSADYDLLDFVYYDEELSDADCASMADDIVGFFGGPAITPIAFSGTIDNIVVSDGDVVSIDLSPYFGGTQTPFTFANIGTALTATGLTLSSAGLLSGTATEGSSAAVQVQGTDADTNTAVSNTFSIAVNAAAALPPQGTVTLGTITVGETTATVPYTYNAADQTGFEYRLNGGAAISDAASPVDLTGLTANTPYTIEVRAVNANGAGAWSAVGNFTTDPTPVADPVIVFGADTALAFNTGGSAGLRPNLTGLSVDIYDVATRALVLSVANHTTDVNAVLANIQNAALAAATEYRIVVLGQDGSEAVFRDTSQ